MKYRVKLYFQTNKGSFIGVLEGTARDERQAVKFAMLEAIKNQSEYLEMVRVEEVKMVEDDANGTNV